MSGKTTKATTQEEAPAEEPRISLVAWCADHAVRRREDGSLVDHRVTGLIGGFEHWMREQGRRVATEAEFEAAWDEFLRREI